MFGNKKGSELSMNVIIIAAIALLVLVILSVLVLQKFGKLNEGTGCEGLGGSCMISTSCNLADGMITSPTDDCKNTGEVCCYKLSNSQN
jgi:hypothetical protein